MKRIGKHHPALTAAKWIGTCAGVAGAVLIALNLGFVVYGFEMFLVSSVLWSAVGWVQREPSLVVLQGAFTAINVLGIYRWMAPYGSAGLCCPL